ncbi:hypothetical protein AArcSl_0837 [Halalkaliarchaeum desulfuricum]|uniref:Uncharacterized protein n=1 Tax=Halalkaliarchaeum desulfuricum TaxID=2055893 RepID=A0A343THA8_9EURY|nr:hypothetical protein [Halalkaliarchaeum desulfuricum]AUX08480.1 hypothetical protein AArcSl_0837 [Halalkaliarchaeum desulfuricum]
MATTDRLGGTLLESRRNAALFWVLVGVLSVFVIERVAIAGDVRTAVLAAVLLVIALVPPVAFRDPTVTLPWELVGIACLPLVWEFLVGVPFRTDVVPYVAVAVVALFLAVELHAFTPVRMTHRFAIAFVTLSTMAAAAVYNVGQWLSDVLFGTAFLLDGRDPDVVNAVVMIEFTYATVAGILAGVAFAFFFERRISPASERTYVPPYAPGEERERRAAVEGKTLARRLHLSERTQRHLTRGMQIVLGIVLAYGVWTLHLPTIANATVALVITFVPALLERDLELPMDPGLVLWITVAVFLHALGSAGLYDAVGPWDHLTHALSASVVAAAGYAGFRAIHLHTDAVYLPPKFMGLLIGVFVLAAGVVWELLEFAIDQFAIRAGIPAVLAQHGIGDTMMDLLFNLVGAFVTAVWGTVYLADVADSMSERFEEWGER